MINQNWSTHKFFKIACDEQFLWMMFKVEIGTLIVKRNCAIANMSGYICT